MVILGSLDQKMPRSSYSPVMVRCGRIAKKIQSRQPRNLERPIDTVKLLSPGCPSHSYNRLSHMRQTVGHGSGARPKLRSKLSNSSGDNFVGKRAPLRQLDPMSTNAQPDKLALLAAEEVLRT